MYLEKHASIFCYNRIVFNFDCRKFNKRSTIQISALKLFKYLISFRNCFNSESGAIKEYANPMNVPSIHHVY